MIQQSDDMLEVSYALVQERRNANNMNFSTSFLVTYRPHACVLSWSVGT